MHKYDAIKCFQFNDKMQRKLSSVASN